jgi:hypothetical protein
MHLHWLSPVKKKSVALAARVVMLARVTGRQHAVYPAALVAPTQHLLMAAISPPKQVVMSNPPLSAYVK